MADAPTKPTRSRRGAKNDDDDEQETPVVAQVPTTATEAAPAPAPAPAAAPAPGSRRGAPRAAQFSGEAMAVAAAGVAPPPAAAVPPPASSAAAPPPSAAGSAAAAQRHADPASAGGAGSAGALHDAEDLYSVDYDTVSFADLTGVYMKRFTRAQVENAMMSHLQGGADEGEESSRVEKFLDVSAAALSSSVGAGATGAAAIGKDDEENIDHAQGYTYGEMLTRLYEQLNRNHEGSALMERNQVPVPILEKIGKKKTVISNFGRICDVIHRPVEDVKDFIEKELAIRGNLDSNNALILKYQTNKATDFDRIIIKYLDEYVKCNSCHRIDTTLTKDGRRLELRCNWCTATRTVTTAGSATYSALVEKRSRQRAAAAMTL